VNTFFIKLQVIEREYLKLSNTSSPTVGKKGKKKTKEGVFGRFCGKKTRVYCRRIKIIIILINSAKLTAFNMNHFLSTVPYTCTTYLRRK
jgi:hypothetical protein